MFYFKNVLWWSGTQRGPYEVLRTIPSNPEAFPQLICLPCENVMAMLCLLCGNVVTNFLNINDKF